jgi:23S rRNA pseudouridine1911/1915/1917 synthase
MSNPEDNQTETVTVAVPEETSPQRLDSYLASHPEIGLSRSRIQKLIEKQLVLVDSQVVDKKYRVKGGEAISLVIPPPEPSGMLAEDIPLELLYEDEHLVVVNKPPGMVTHPAAGNRTGTLANGLVHHFGRLAASAGSDRPGIVHRLDKNTSGLLVVARSDEVYAALQKGIQSREIKRTYLALVCGHLKPESGSIELPIGRSVRNRKKMSVVATGGREAVTDYKLLERFRTYDLLEIRLQTGRTHQIRVHLSHLRHPVFGDPDYGGREKWHRGIFGPERPLARKLLDLIDRQVLHAARLEFVHPVSGKELVFETEPPDDFGAVLKLLKAEGS